MHIDSSILENSIYIMEEELLEECMSKSQNEYSEYLERKKILREIEVINEIKKNKVIIPFLLCQNFYKIKGILDVLKENTSGDYFSLLEKQIYFFFLKGVITNVKKTEKQIEINFFA